MHRRIAAPLLALALVVGPTLAACAAAGSATPGASSACPTAPDPGQPAGWGVPSTMPATVPVLVNPGGDLTCGPNRLIFSFVDPAGRPISSPDRTASVKLYDLARDSATPTATLTGTFVWAIQGSVGVYIATGSFNEAGVWGAEFSTTAGGTSSTARLTFSVNPSSPTVRVGQPAPRSKTPTGDPATISTDPSPLPAFYATSIDSAIANHQPFLVAFATPKFCTSGQCGPTLERVKAFVSSYPTVTFINVEPYVLKSDGGSLQAVLTNNNLTPVQATLDWGLQSEPWVFVVDRTGIVRGSYGVIFSDAELTAVLDSVK